MANAVVATPSSRCRGPTANTRRCKVVQVHLLLQSRTRRALASHDAAEQNEHLQLHECTPHTWTPWRRSCNCYKKADQNTEAVDEFGDWVSHDWSQLLVNPSQILRRRVGPRVGLPWLPMASVTLRKVPGMDVTICSEGGNMSYQPPRACERP